LIVPALVPLEPDVMLSQLLPSVTWADQDIVPLPVFATEKLVVPLPEPTG
jgi:hypothetical protein